MQNQATTNARLFARTLRRAMTDGERLLWKKLRGEQLDVKFRRQHPLGSYVADFARLAPRLIIEIDGSQHADQQAYDAKREAFFKSQGFELMRFPANLPFSDLQSMVEAIYNRLTLLAALAPSQPSPSGGRSKKFRRLRPLYCPFTLWGKVGMGAPPAASRRTVFKNNLH